MGFLRTKFAHPMPSQPRTALLCDLYRPSRSAALFPDGDPDRLAQWGAECIAGFLEQVEMCAAEPTHGIIVFSLRGHCLTAADRDRLWARFGVPVFEQIVDADGRLLATECEGHAGLHLVCGLDAAPPGVLRRGVCACGADTTRLFPVPAADQRTLTVTRS